MKEVKLSTHISTIGIIAIDDRHLVHLHYQHHYDPDPDPVGLSLKQQLWIGVQHTGATLKSLLANKQLR